jgi:hypothetical protein
MKQLRRWAVCTAVAAALTACGGADTPVGETTLYKAAATFDLANNQAASLSSVVLSINDKSPVTTGPGCDGSKDEPVTFRFWAGDFTDLGLYTNYSTDLERVAAMVVRDQPLGSWDRNQYLSFLTAATSGQEVTGDKGLDVLSGTTEVWYEFYCSTGTLSAGKVAL